MTTTALSRGLSRASTTTLLRIGQPSSLAMVRETTVSNSLTMPTASVLSLSNHPLSIQYRNFSRKIHRMENRYNVDERRRLRYQKKGRRIFLPAYVSIRDFSKRLGVTMMMTHKAGSIFFSWWPRASARQLRRDGFSMLKDVVLRYDESATLARRLGYTPEYEYVGVERIRNEHYARKLGLIAEDYITSGNGPRELPAELRPSHIQPKQPVVCIVGHVNHGKTTLLDAMRGTDIASREAGLITQDMYSFQAYLGEDTVKEWGTRPEFSETSIGRPPTDDLKEFPAEALLDVYKRITFLDTPGHASFYDMRENAVMYCDISMLVVSAVEGLCSQTLESIEYVKAFKTPVLVVLTKCDDPAARPTDVIRQLKSAGLNMVEHSDRYVYSNLFPPEPPKRGIIRRTKEKKRQETPYICVSAKTGQNMSELKRTLMKIFMTTRPQCDTEAPPVGMVVEGINEAGGRGRVVRILLSSGVIRRQDRFVTGIFQGRVRDIRSYGLPTQEQEEANTQAQLHNLLSVEEKLRLANANSPDSAAGALVMGANSALAMPSANTSLVAANPTGANFLVRPNNKMLRWSGPQMEIAIPGVPLEIMGAESLPQAGDDFRIVSDPILARFIAECRRLEVDYDDQARFRLAGLKPTTWVPPPSPDEMKLMSIEELQRAAALQAPEVLALSADGMNAPNELNNPVLDINDMDDDMSDDEKSLMKYDDDDDFVIDGNESDDDASNRQQGLGRYAFGDVEDTYAAEVEDELEVTGSSATGAWDAHWDVNTMDADARQVLVKAGTAGGLRMITDSINAYNRRFPSRAIEITHSGVGRLTTEDIRRANNANEISPCPVFLYRVQKTHKKMAKEATEYGVHIETHEVFDDLLKSMVGPSDFHRLFDETKSIRPALSPMASFKSNPVEIAPVLSLKELYERELAQKEVTRLLRSEEREKNRVKDERELERRQRRLGLSKKITKKMISDGRKDSYESDMDDMVERALKKAMDGEGGEKLRAEAEEIASQIQAEALQRLRGMNGTRLDTLPEAEIVGDEHFLDNVQSLNDQKDDTTTGTFGFSSEPRVSNKTVSIQDMLEMELKQMKTNTD